MLEGAVSKSCDAHGPAVVISHNGVGYCRTSEWAADDALKGHLGRSRHSDETRLETLFSYLFTLAVSTGFRKWLPDYLERE